MVVSSEHQKIAPWPGTGGHGHWGHGGFGQPSGKKISAASVTERLTEITKEHGFCHFASEGIHLLTS